VGAILQVAMARQSLLLPQRIGDWRRTRAKTSQEDCCQVLYAFLRAVHQESERKVEEEVPFHARGGAVWFGSARRGSHAWN